MGEEKCGECRSWEEEIYWSHFQSIHFSQILPPDFYHHLAIPETFSRHLKKKLPKVVTLKGPSGLKWEVGLTTKSGVMFFTHGWFEFSIEHLLCEKDLLVFKYNGESQFDVLVFEGHSMCEKAATYFVRKCGHRENCNGCCQAKRKIRESSVDEINTPTKTVIQDMAVEEAASDDTDEAPSRIPTIEDSPHKRIRRKINFMDPSLTKQRRMVEPPPGFHDVNAITTSSELMAHGSPAQETTSDDIDEVPVRVPITDRRAFKSIWRKIKVKDPYRTKQSKRNEAPPAEKEKMKDNSLCVGRAAVTKDGFFVVMKPTNLFPKFYVAVPTEWIKKQFISPRKQNVILCFKDRSWCINFLYNQRSKRSGSCEIRAYLCGGWKAFAVENRLKEFDVCIFEPETPVNGPFRLNVNIIRCHLKDQDDCQTIRNTKGTSADVLTATQKIVVQDKPTEKTSSDNIYEIPIRVCSTEDLARHRIQQKVDFMEPSKTKLSMTIEPPPGFLDVNALTTPPTVVQALPEEETETNDGIDGIQGVPIQGDTDHNKIWQKIDTVEPSITKQGIRNYAYADFLCEAPPCFINEAPTGLLDIDYVATSLQVIAQASPVDKTANNGTHEKPFRVPITADKAPKNIWQKIELKGPSVTKLSKEEEASPAFVDVDTVTSSPKTSTDDTDGITSRVPITENTAICQKIDVLEVSVANHSTRNEAPPGFPEAADSEPDVEHKPIIPESLVQNVRKVSSKRKRLMTEEEKMKDNAMQAAQATVTREGFFVIMKPTNLSPKFFVVIPTNWMKKQLINPVKQNVILCFEDRTWNIQFLCYDGIGGGHERLRGFLSAGWKSFALDNMLKELDVCVFEPADTPADVPYRFNVNIIRSCPEQEAPIDSQRHDMWNPRI